MKSAADIVSAGIACPVRRSKARAICISRGIKMWEIVKETGNHIKSDRHKVLGGWIVRTFKSDEYGLTEKQTFVSDPLHKWKLYKEAFPAKTKVFKKEND